MIETVPFRPAHLAVIEADELTPETVPQLQARTREALAFAGVTFMRDGRPIGAAAFLLTGGPEGVCWLAPSDELKAHPAYLYRTALAVIESARTTLGLDRLVTSVPADWPTARRWVEALGFCLRRELGDLLGDGRDHLEYVLEWRPE